MNSAKNYLVEVSDGKTITEASEEEESGNDYRIRSGSFNWSGGAEEYRIISLL